MGYDWKNYKWREGWFARRAYEAKRRPLWILIGFLLREIVRLAIFTLIRN